jgi:hypothetical protein
MPSVDSGPVVAAILTIARFCRPQSELHIESTWYRGTALEDLLGAPVQKVHTDRLYAGLDWLPGHKAAIEKHLKGQLGVLFDLEYERLEERLRKMQASAACGRLKDGAAANRRLGRLLGQYWRAAGAFEVNIHRLSPPQGKQRLRITWKRNRRWSEWAALSEGCYLLRTNLNETDPAVLWKRYIQLTEAEWAFRITKDELEIRPIWHQKQDRVLAHILVCFLAYVLGKTLAHWMRRSRLGDAPGRCWRSWPRSKAATWCCPPKASAATTPAPSGDAASPSRTRPKTSSSTASASPSPDACDGSTRPRQCSETNGQKMNVSPLLPTNRPAQVRNLG